MTSIKHCCRISPWTRIDLWVATLAKSVGVFGETPRSGERGYRAFSVDALGYCGIVGLTLVLSMSMAHAQTTAPAGNVTVVPATVKLSDMRQPQSLLVLGRTADGFALDLTDHAVLRSTDESVAVVDRGWVRPLKSGEAKITVQAAGQTIA